MEDAGSIRALLIGGDSEGAILTRDLLDEASAGLVELVHIDDLSPALDRLASEAFDVVLFRLKRWQDAGLPAITMAVNLSARQLIKPGLAALVASIVEEFGLRPDQLQLELKETALLHDFTASARTLNELKEIGARIALDDFGNGGASAISYLRRLPIDVIKLDRTLIQETGHPGTEQIVTLALTELAHSLAIKVVAEGVETPAQLSFLREAGCDIIQGYLVSPPLDVDAMATWLGHAPSVLPDGARQAIRARRRQPKRMARLK